MRVIYKNEGVTPYIPSNPQPGKTKKESVLIITSKTNVDSTKDKGYDITISKEALARDAEVRAHEEAHIAILGSTAKSGIIYDTIKGPGGETIAVGGKIAVDLTEEPGNPSATLSKARTIISAANAPDNQSVADMETAAKAYRLARAAQEQLNQQQNQNNDVDLLV